MAIASIILFAALTIPETNQRTLDVAPLGRGEISFVDNGNGSACVQIGASGRIPFDVVENSGIHGYKTSRVPRDEFYVVYPVGYTYFPSNDEWRCSTIAAHGTVSFYAQMKPDIRILEADLTFTGRGTSQVYNLSPSVTITDNVVTFAFSNTWNFALSDINVYNASIEKIDYGEVGYVNDLTEKTFVFRDALGEFGFGGLRSWAKHLYDGNRGSDWSSHPAKSTVNMMDHHLVFGTTNNPMSRTFSVGLSRDMTNAVDFISDGDIILRIGNVQSSSVVPNGATITNLNPFIKNGVLRIPMIVSGFAPGTFDVTKLKMYRTEEISSDSRNFTEVDFTTSGAYPVYTNETALARGNRGFYMVKYGDISSLVEFFKPIKVHELRLTGDDGKLYRISVNGGVITATEITE